MKSCLYKVAGLGTVLVTVCLPSIAQGQVPVWDFGNSSVSMSLSAERYDEDGRRDCNRSDSAGASPIVPGTAYSGRADCSDAMASASFTAELRGEFLISGSVGAFSDYPIDSGAVANLECVLVFTVPTDSPFLVDFYVDSQGSADRDLRFALVGPSGPIMVVEPELLPWDRMEEDVSLSGNLLAGETYQIEISFNYDAWDNNQASIDVSDFRYTLPTPIRAASWGQIKRGFGSDEIEWETGPS